MDTKKIVGGVVGGLAGGIVMGLMMSMVMAPVMVMISHLWGFDSFAAGWFVHLVNSAIIGAAFAVVLGGKVHSTGSGAGWGLVYGAVWWVLGPLFIMPLWLMGTTAFASAMTVSGMMELMAHLVFGVVLGFVYAWYVSKQGAANAAPAHV